TLAKRPYMFVETYFSQTAMMPVNILSICGMKNILNLYPTKTNTTRAPVQTGLLKRLIYDTKSDH
ncbi:hypothetical protein NEW94_RS26645, partial [Escherichia coli]